VKKIIQYKVSGTWPFPFDMLRYDESQASTEEDQLKIDLLDVENPTLEIIKRRFVVTLKTNNPKDLSWHPTERRWNSFCWRVE
jgi:hypothetical protein